MKKYLKRVIAIVAAIAMTVTGMTFTPSKTSAATDWIDVADSRIPTATSGSAATVERYTLGTATDFDEQGVWDLQSSQNQWANWHGRYKNADDYEGFTVHNQVYQNRGGIYVWTHDLKPQSAFNLQQGKTYHLTVTVDFTGVNADQPTQMVTEGGDTNMNVSKTATAGASTQTYEANVVPGSGEFNLKFCYTKNYQTCEVGTFTFTSIVFEEADTFIPLANATITQPSGTPWTLFAETNDDNKWGRMSYDIDGAAANVNGTNIRVDNGSGWMEAWATYAKLLNYGAIAKDTDNHSLVDGNFYEATINYSVSQTTPTPVSGEPRMLGVNFFGQGVEEYEVDSLTNNITIEDFQYDASNDDIIFWLDEIKAGTEFRVDSITFTPVESGWGMVPVRVTDTDPKFTPTGTPWTINVLRNEQETDGTWGQMKYKVDGDASAIGSTKMRLLSTSGVKSNWWNSAALVDYATTAGLEEDFTYTGTITFNSTNATESGKKLYVYFQGNEYAFSLNSGNTTLNIPSFVYDSGASKDIEFNFEEIPNNTDVYVSDITFTKAQDEQDFVVVPHSVDHIATKNNINTPWTLHAEYNGVPETGTWGKLWYKVAGTTQAQIQDMGSTTIRVVNNAAAEQWVSAKLANYTVGKMTAGHSYTCTVTWDYEDNSNKSGASGDILSMAIPGAEDGNNTFNMDADDETFTTPEFEFNGSSSDVVFALDKLRKGSDISIKSVTFEQTDDDFTVLTNDGEYYAISGTPWKLRANGTGDSHGAMKYKVDSPAATIGNTTMRLTATGENKQWWWLSAKLEDYATTAGLIEDFTYSGSVVVNVSQAVPAQALDIVFNSHTFTNASALTAGTNTIPLSQFVYTPAESKDIEFNLGGMPNKTDFSVSSITFTAVNPEGWIPAAQNTDVTAGVWTLHSQYDGQPTGTWGRMWYKTSGSDLDDTTVKVMGPGGEYVWNTATLTDYLASRMSAGHTYAVDIDYTIANATAGDTVTITVGNNPGSVESVANGLNAYSIESFEYDGTNEDIQFIPDGLTKGAEFTVTGITIEQLDAGFENVPSNNENFKPAANNPWTLFAAYNASTNTWGAMKYKVEGTGEDVSDTTMRLVTNSQSDDYNWTIGTLKNYATTAGLDTDFAYTGAIVINDEAEGTIKVVVDGTEYTQDLSQSHTIAIPQFTFTGASNDITFFFNNMEDGTDFNVESITFTRVDAGWQKVPANNETFKPSQENPWTLTTINDGVNTWGKMQYKVDGTASAVNGTTIKVVNAGGTEEWNFAKLKNYLTSEMSAGHTYSFDMTYTIAGASANDKVTIAVANNPGSLETVSNGTNTYSIESFDYDGTNSDIVFMLDKLSNETTLKVNSITITQLDAGFENVPANVTGGYNPTGTPWYLTVTNDATSSWGAMKYKVEDPSSALGNTTLRLVNNSQTTEYSWTSAALPNYATTAGLESDFDYTGSIIIDSEAEGILKVVVDGTEYTLDLSQSHTLSIPQFTFRGAANGGSDDIVFMFDQMTNGTDFSVVSMSFPRVDAGWQKVPANNETFKPSQENPWTLTTINDGVNTWGKMQYKVDGTASAVNGTTIKVVNAGGTEEWNFAKLKNYLTSEMSAGHTYSFDMTYTIAGASANDKVTIAVANNPGSLETVSNGTNTYSIESFDYDGTNSDIVFMLDKLSNGTTLKVNSITITQLDAGYENVPANVQAGYNPTGTPWYLTVTNDGSSSWGAMKYKVDGQSGVVGDTSFILTNNSGTTDYSWTSATLKNYAPTAGLESDFAYTGSIQFNPEAEGTVSVTFNGTTYTKTFSNAEGGHTLTIPEFTYRGADYGESDDFVFNFDQMTNGTEFAVENMTFVRVEPEWIKVPGTEGGVSPTGTPWTLKSFNNKSTTWGRMQYKVDSPASDIGNTTMRLINMGGDNEWNFAVLEGYAASNMSVGKFYTATVQYQYDDNGFGKSGAAGDELTMSLNGTSYDLDVDETSFTTEEFNYTGSDSDVTFFLDKLSNGGELKVTSVTFTPQGNWTRVPDNTPTFKISDIPYDYAFRNKDGSFDPTHVTGTRDWYVFAGEWNNPQDPSIIEGCILYYDQDFTKTGQPMVKIGEGNRGDPACAQVKVHNDEAYQDLDDYTNYYMTYTFYSSEEGDVHITHEGYEPNAPEKFHVQKGMNTYRKILTILPESRTTENSIYMSLTASTYGPGGEVIPDGTPLPVGTELYGFKVEYQRTDADLFTLITDSRDGTAHYDPIVKDNDNRGLLNGYTNSYYGGRMSYKEGAYAEGEDDIAKMTVRLDATSGNFGPLDNLQAPWPCHLRIPNDYFYGRTDTDGNALVEGKTYKLRFFYNVDLTNAESEIADGKGLVMVRQGYDEWLPARYETSGGLNMANGTITAKNGYTSHDNYNKTGGIDMVYNPYATIPTEYVQFDFSEIPAGAEISDISWEFWAPQYDVYIDGNKNTENPITEGQTYTFPSTGAFADVAYYEDSDGNQYAPGSTVPFATFNDIIQGDLYVTAVRNHTVTIVDADHPSVEIQTASVEHGDNYTLPTISGVEYYTYDNVDYDPGDVIGPIEDDETVYAHLAQNTHTVIILNPDGTNYSTTVVADGDPFTFPSGQDLDNIKNFVNTSDPTDTKTKGTQISVTSDLTYQMVPYNYYTITIDGTVDQTVREDQTYTWPTGSHVIGYDDKGSQERYNPGSTFTPARDYDVTTVYGYSVTIVDENGDVLYEEDDIESGDSFTLFDETEPGYENIDHYEGVEGTTGTYQPGEAVEIQDSDLTFKAIMKAPVTTYNWTVDGQPGGTVEAGTEITLPSTATIGYLLEYTDGQDQGATDDLYKPASTYVVNRNVNFISINSVALNPTPGAAMRFEGDSSETAKDARGIAFAATLTVNGGTNENILSSDAFQTGMIITSLDAFTDIFEEDITIEKVAADTTGSAVDIQNTGKDAEKWTTGQPGNYRCGITHMKDANIARDFVARGYTKITFVDGSTYDTIYADNPSSQTARNIKQIATLIYTEHYDYYATLPKAWQEMVLECMEH